MEHRSIVGACVLFGATLFLAAVGQKQNQSQKTDPTPPPAVSTPNSHTFQDSNSTEPKTKVIHGCPKSPSSNTGADGRKPTAQARASRMILNASLPVFFEPLPGQSGAPSAARFVLRTPQYDLLLAQNGGVLEFHESGAGHCDKLHACRSGAAPVEFLHLNFAGASSKTRIEGEGAQSSFSNYLVGNDPGKWRTHVPHFGEVRYRDVYPGIDLVFRSHLHRLEYDFLLTPYASPDLISIRLDGIATAHSFRVGEDGSLSLQLAGGKVVMQRPVVYEGRGCSSGEDGPEVAAREGRYCHLLAGGAFVIRKRGRGEVPTIGFALPTYDHSQPLVIDPAVAFSTFLGGTTDDGANGVALDPQGNIYITGTTNSTNFPVTNGAIQPNLAGNQDIFVTKLAPDGSHLIYSTYLGGTNSDFAHGIAVDASGDVYVTGETYSTDFPTVNAFQSISQGGNGFVSKLKADGSSLVYSTYLGGSLEGATNAIAVDSAGEAVVAGRTNSTDFPVLHAFQQAHAIDSGDSDATLTKLSASGSSLVFSTYLGGNSNDFAMGVALDASGNIYVAGLTFSSDFPIVPGSFETTYSATPGGTGFVSKFNPTGSQLTYSTFLVGGNINAVAVNGLSQAFVTGSASSALSTTGGAFQTTTPNPFLGAGAGFVTGFNTSGSALVYSTFLGGNNGDVGNAIAIDSSNDVYVTGETSSTNFPVQAPLQPAYAGSGDAFVSELSPSGSQLIFSTFLGGGAQGFGTDEGFGVAVDSSGEIVAAGSTNAPDFPVLNALQPVLAGFGNAFVTKFTRAPAPVLSLSPPSLTFASQVVTVKSAAQTLTLQNSGSANLSISQVSVTGDYSVTNSCTAPVAPNSACQLNVNFTPTIAGDRPGMLTISSNATLQPDVVQLDGTGQDFIFEGAPGATSVSPGQSAQVALTLMPLSDFNQMVSLSCSALPPNASCVFTPPSKTLDGTDTANVQLSINTSAGSSLVPLRSIRPRQPWASLKVPGAAIWLGSLLAAWSFFWLMLVRSRSLRAGFVTLASILLFGFALVACGGGGNTGGGGGGGSGNSPTPAGTYSVVINATSEGSLKHGLVFQLTVN